MEGYYCIAGLNVQLDSFGMTMERAEKYRMDRPEHIDLEVKVHNLRDNLTPDLACLTDSQLEYLATGSIFTRKLLNFDGFRLHSSAVVVDGRAYLFSADSGTGKSTHTKLWLKLFGDRAYILNDDKPSLRRVDGVWYAYGTPWSGKDDMSVNTRVPVAGIAMVERSDKNAIAPFSGPEAIRSVLSQCNRPRDMESRIKLLELLDSIFRQVPIWKLRCNMEDEAAVVSYEAMSGKKFKENE